MSGSIRLHPKHGVNPTIPVCAWCGKERNEVALLGAAYRGEAPRNMVIDDEPCDACKAGMAQGITFIEAEQTFDGPRRTGRWCVVREELVRESVHPPELRDAILKRRAAYVEPADWRALGLPVKDRDAAP